MEGKGVGVSGKEAVEMAEATRPAAAVDGVNWGNGGKEKGGANLVSLFVQNYMGLSFPGDDTPLRLLWGQETIEERVLGLTFQVSPRSFFQVNTKGCERLYRKVIQNLTLGDDITVLDVCCGAGTIGLCAAKEGGARKVIGVEISASAVEDARSNARANNVSNAEFVCDRAEKALQRLLHEAGKSHASQVLSGTLSSSPIKFAAIVDPPRAGLMAPCLRALRSCTAIERLVYVSCNPTKSLVNDSVLLCGPSSKKTKGAPFRPVKAIPVDMFPHTNHTELIMVFERFEPEPSTEGEGEEGEEVAAGTAQEVAAKS
ncbi:unnamed protein product [Discosporangium mesarthrocarpum]